MYGFAKYIANAIDVSTDRRELLYRSENIKVKEMTISEVEKELGYPIKIVKEDKQ